MPIKRLLAALLCVLLLAVSAGASNGFADEMEPFLKKYGLHEGNFSLCYYNTVTGEEYRCNPDAMMVAASTYKLPLNMYYYEMEASGEIAPDAYIPNSGTTLDVCHRLSLAESNNEVSIAMLYNLGSFRTYKDCMRKYFTQEEVPAQYYADNYYSTAMMMDALKYLYAHESDFTELLGYLKQAQPGAYFKKYISDCEIAHKFGSFEGAENDVGIIYAGQPFLLAVYTQGTGEDIPAKAALLAKDYTDRQYEAQLLRQEESHLAEEAKILEEARSAVTAAKAEVKASALSVSAEEGGAFPVWIFPVVSAVCLAASGVLIAVQKRQKAKIKG